MLYSAKEITLNNSNNNHFRLHNHDEYEICLFLEGDSKFIVEEKIYDLSPCDIMVMKKNEMHRIFHNRETRYKRVVIMVSPDFFIKNNCTEYEAPFLKEHLNAGNKIKAELVRSSGLYDAILRFKEYSDNFTISDKRVLNSTMIEILYLINKISVFENADNYDKTIKNVINYINNSYTEDITLEMLSDRFFISKYYLCHIFKKATGLTVLQYINQKRLTLALDLVKEGKSLTEASLLSGFNSYSSFYRTYMKKYKQSPFNKTFKM